MKRAWSKIVLAASIVPMFCYLALIGWFDLIYRPSGNEVWGDAVWLFYAGIVAYLFSMLLFTRGVFLLMRENVSNPDKGRVGRALIGVSVAMMVLPVAIFATAPYR